VDAHSSLKDFASAVPEGENKGNDTSTITADDSVSQNCDGLISDDANTGDRDKTIINDDPATWPKVICDDLRIKLANQGPQQITDFDFPKNYASKRKFSVSY
jgi:predicted secreted protein